jgi:hypothetical protein
MLIVLSEPGFAGGVSFLSFVAFPPRRGNGNGNGNAKICRNAKTPRQ